MEGSASSNEPKRHGAFVRYGSIIVLLAIIIWLVLIIAIIPVSIAIKGAALIILGVVSVLFLFGDWGRSQMKAWDSTHFDPATTKEKISKPLSTQERWRLPFIGIAVLYLAWPVAGAILLVMYVPVYAVASWVRWVSKDEPVDQRASLSGSHESLTQEERDRDTRKLEAMYRANL